MKAMILAAGKGERLRPLTLKTPKPLVRVNGKPLIVYHIERLARAGVHEIIINHSWLGQQLPDILGTGQQWGVTLTFSEEETPLGTGGGIKKAFASSENQPFILVSADIFTDYPFHTLVQKELPEHIGGHLVLINNPDHHPSGDFGLEDGLVRQKKSTSPTFTYGSIALLTPKLFSMNIPYPFSISLPFDQAITQNLLTGEHFTGYHCNVDTPERLQKVENDRKSDLISDGGM